MNHEAEVLRAMVAGWERGERMPFTNKEMERMVCACKHFGVECGPAPLHPWWVDLWIRMSRWLRR